MLGLIQPRAGSQGAEHSLGKGVGTVPQLLISSYQGEDKVQGLALIPGW